MNCVVVTVLAVLAVALPFGAGVSAQDRVDGPSAADLVEICESDAPATRDSCGRLIGGLIEVYVLLGSRDPMLRIACPPRMMSDAQMRNAFLGWATPRSDLREMGIPDAIVLSLKERFPC